MPKENRETKNISLNTLRNYMKATIKEEWVRVAIEKMVEDMLKEYFKYYQIAQKYLINKPELLDARLDRELRLFTNILKYDERTMEDVEFWLNKIDRTQSGKTKIFMGKGVILMNFDSYLEYQEKEINEPHTMVVLQKENKDLKENNTRLLENCERWFNLLGQSGINSKAIVRDEREAVLEELKGDTNESL